MKDLLKSKIVDKTVSLIVNTFRTLCNNFPFPFYFVLLFKTKFTFHDETSFQFQRLKPDRYEVSMRNSLVYYCCQCCMHQQQKQQLVNFTKAWMKTTIRQPRVMFKCSMQHNERDNSCFNITDIYVHYLNFYRRTKADSNFHVNDIKTRLAAFRLFLGNFWEIHDVL